MHYLFLDESYPPVASPKKKIVIAAWAVEQNKWASMTAQRFDLFDPPVLKRICLMLESLDAAAVVGEATLDETLFRSGEKDGTDDIPSMSRSDNIWSMSATFVLASLIVDLIRYGKSVGTVDVHFDRKNLKPMHSIAWEETLRQTLVTETKQFASQLGAKILTKLIKLGIRRVQAVPKLGHLGKESDKFRSGTWVADKLCSYSGEINGLKCSRISTDDISEVVRKTAQQFDGKPFHEP